MLGFASTSNYDKSPSQFGMPMGGATAQSGASLGGAKTLGAAAGGEPNLMSIIASVQNDIKNLRTHLENIPAFPKGKYSLLLKYIVFNFRSTASLTDCQIPVES